MGRRARSTNGENKFGHSSLSLSLQILFSLSGKRNETKTRETHRKPFLPSSCSSRKKQSRKKERDEDRSSGKLWNRRLSWVTLSRHVTVSESLPLPRPRRTIGRRGLIQGSLHSSKVLPSRAPIFSRTYRKFYDHEKFSPLPINIYNIYWDERMERSLRIYMIDWREK